MLRAQRLLIRIGVLCALVSFPFAVWGQVAPTSSAPWRSPDLRGYTSVLKSGERSPIDPEKRYELVELIDLAQRLNPETRVAWEAARQAAIGVGLVESEYFPVLALSGAWGLPD